MAPYRAPGYYDEVVAAGKMVGDELVLSNDAYFHLAMKYRKRAPSSPEVTAKRREICGKCPDTVCNGKPCTELERMAEDGLCPLNMWQE